MIALQLARDRYPAWYRVIVPEYATTPRSGFEVDSVFASTDDSE